MPQDPPPMTSRDLPGHPRFAEAIGLVSQPIVRDLTDRYRPWRKVRPIARDANLDPELVWIATKFRRMAMWQPLPLVAANGRRFVLAQLGTISEQLHRIDRETGGGGLVALEHEHGVLSDLDSQRRFLIRSMMDEAIDSSVIEGAKTSVEVARDLLRSGRPPRDKSERMVANNYAVMKSIKASLGQPLTTKLLIEWQRILTDHALDDDAPADGSGRLRRPDESVRVEDKRTGDQIYVPPDANGLEQRLSAICEFANAKHSGERFLHPVLKACVLHFMIGYEHPFVDGNGRTARALFYWSALRSGYRAFEFLTISTLIKAAIAKYPQAYIDTEEDEGDLTYFVLYKLDVISRAIERLAAFLSEEEVRIETSVNMLRLDETLNLRQRLLLQHALRHPGADYSARSQANTNGVTLMTARADLESLRTKGFLQTFKVGRAVHYVLDPSVTTKLARASKRRR